MTALGARASGGPPTVGHPWERPVPGASEWTTANPRGTQVSTWELAMPGWVLAWTEGAGALIGGGAPTSWRTFQKYSRVGGAVPEK